ncbi:MAG TPA: Kiwa anti-phage protein KwaB-like domain-containing protein [Candidatus Saccharimonadales bacterium]|nr:Kiwa anti-phage protein KwaB-like domain-containing protein [Candidatus Saccharimonadales bacterium]
MAEDILAPEKVAEDNYVETDIFAWANNLVQYKDELKIDLFLINKNYVVYRTNMAEALGKQLEPLFVDEILEAILEGADMGLQVRAFEEAEAEDNVLQRTRLSNVDKAKEVLNWVKTQEHEIEMFVEEEHDFKRIKGIMARISHPDLQQPAYVFKVLPQSQVMRGKVGWMLRGGKFMPFDADAAVRISSDNQMLLLDQDLYVFNQAKLKALFGYDAKEAAIAKQKVAEIEANYKLSFDEGLDMQTLVKGKKAAIKKLQKMEVGKIKQDEMLTHAEEMGVELMSDDSGAIIIMDDKDMTKFINLLNDDYIESPLTGERYEIIKKRILKPENEEEMLLKEVLK